MKAFLPIALFLFIFIGCASYQEQVTQRTERLRKLYPSGMSRAEVQAKWNGKSDFSASRPPNGWQEYANSYLGKKLSDLETNTGKRIDLVDRYWGPDGLWSLCYCWYYYDSDSKLIDVEWQYKSD